MNYEQISKLLRSIQGYLRALQPTHQYSQRRATNFFITQIDEVLKPPDVKRVPLERAEAIARTIAGELQHKVPSGWGFVFLLCELDKEPASITYTSNCDRQGIARMLRLGADKVEKAEDESTGITGPAYDN